MELWEELNGVWVDRIEITKDNLNLDILKNAYVIEENGKLYLQFCSIRNSDSFLQTLRQITDILDTGAFANHTMVRNGFVGKYKVSSFYDIEDKTGFVDGNGNPYNPVDVLLGNE